MNITEKILAKASGKTTVQPGEIVDSSIDIIMVRFDRPFGYRSL